MPTWEQQYPALFQAAPFSWGGMTAGGVHVQFSLELPPEELVSNRVSVSRWCRG